MVFRSHWVYIVVELTVMGLSVKRPTVSEPSVTGPTALGLLHRFQFELILIPLRWRLQFDFTPHSLQLHFDNTSVSQRIHFGFTSVSLRRYPNTTSSLLRFYFKSMFTSFPVLSDSTPKSLLLYFEISSTHFDVSSISLRGKCYVTWTLLATSLRLHFEFPLIAYRIDFCCTSNSLRF